MTVRLGLKNFVNDGPACFKNFFIHHHHTLVNSNEQTDCMNEILSMEPCNVKYVESHDVSSQTWDGWDSYLEFETEEDYIIFVLRWV